MSAAGRKLRVGDGNRLLFRCPGCDELHVVQHGAGDGPRWGYNGNPDAPTFTPSILVRGTVPITDDQRDRIMAGEKIEPVPRVCHSFVTDGRIQFLGDCTHGLAGQTVELPDFDQGKKEVEA